MPFAFSVHNFISSVGADAGFAAIIGLAVLILLYFAHARETANLREEAAILAARLQQAEAKVAELSRAALVAVPAPETVQVTDQRHAALAPFAPAGMAAPALAAATRVVPLPAAPSPSPPANGGAANGGSAEGEPAEAPPAVAQPEVAQPAVPQPEVAQPEVSRPAVAAAAMPSATATAASVAAPAPPPAPAPAPAPAPPPVAVPPPATAAGANGGARGSTPSIPVPSTSSRGPTTRGAPLRSRQLPPLDPPGRSERSMALRVLVALAALALLGAAVVALLVATSSTGTHGSRSTAPRASNAPAVTRAGAFSPATVTVSVLNGTATNQLAHRVAAKLHAAGYQEGRISTAANQTQSTTIVAYLPGTKNRNDALHVARSLNLTPSAVQPIDRGTQQVACPGPGACTANVVVTVGADLATL